MKNYYMIAAFIFVVLHGAVSSGYAKGSSNYSMETVAEFAIDKIPKEFSLQIGKVVPFERPKNMIEGHEFNFFSVDDNGYLYFLKVNDKALLMCDSLLRKIETIQLAPSNYVSLRYFWLGPNDNIYALLAERNSLDRSKADYFISRFYWTKTGVREDKGFSSPRMEKGPYNVIINPDNTISVAEAQEDADGNHIYSSLGLKGNIIQSSIASGKTQNGVEFYLRHRKEEIRILTEAIRVDNGASLFAIEGDGAKFKCTLDNHILVLFWEYQKIPLNDDKYIRNNTPFVVDVDMGTGNIGRINLYEEIDNMGYLYKNISYVDFNYEGDIYVSVVYYNEPGILAGDEKLVIYRWRKY